MARRPATVMYEFMRIARDDSGHLSFFAQPRGVAPAGFPAIHTTPTEVVFENPAHDFPQRIVYRFEAPATLRAYIEGTIDAKTRRVLAIGAEAKRMVGRTPANIIAVRPLRDGVISDFDQQGGRAKYLLLQQRITIKQQTHVGFK